jgi:hypothetical protein
MTFVKNRIGCPLKTQRDLHFYSNISLPEGLLMLIEWRKKHINQVVQRRTEAELHNNGE